MPPRTVPAAVIAGTHRGCGKTTFATGLMAAWRKAGLAVQPFKIGADAVETGYHEMASGRPSIVLDLWIMSPKALETSFASASVGADIMVLDGARGFYDGSDLAVGPVSTWDVASRIKAPVLLVMDASGMAESAASIALGFTKHRPNRIAGILLNRVAGPRHFEVIRRAIEKYAELPVFGYLPPDAGLEIPSFQSGLVAAEHLHSGQALLPALVEKLEKFVDLKRVMEAVSFGVEVDAPEPEPDQVNRVRIGVARDPAFHFYYEDNLTLLRSAGAEIVPFSPMRDPALPPDLGAIYFGGGIPESCAAVLERNQTMREAIRTAVNSGLPVYAESGGMLYLCTNLVGTGIRAWEMCGVIPGEMRMVSRFPSAAYVAAEVEQASLMVRPGERYQGNEFRISIWTGGHSQAPAWNLFPPSGGEPRPEGFVKENLHASYVHLHFASAPELPARFVAAARAYLQKGGPKKKKDFRKAKQRSRER